MKKFYALLLILICGSGVLKAQTSVDITWASDSSDFNANCDGSNIPISFFLEVATTGYIGTEDATVTIDFGDGTDTTFTVASWSFPYYYGYAPHTYANAGSYDVTYTVTMPDMNSDTEIVYNEISIVPCEIISGYIYNDNNTNCVYDGTDNFMQLGVMATDPITGYYLGYTTSDINGYYELLVAMGSNVNITLNTWLSVNYNCPASGVITAAAPSSNNDFAIDCGSSHDIYPNAYGWLQPGFTQNLYAFVFNSSCSPSPDGTISLVSANSLVTVVSGAAAGGDVTPTISGSTYTWDLPATYINDPGYMFGNGLDLTVSLYTDPSAVIGDTICFDLIAEPIPGDLNPTNNVQTICLVVAGSYDPNYIEASPGGFGPQGIIDPNTDMLYTIHFQNTGNYPATFVNIKDTLDVNTLDLSTFEFVASSHPLTNIISSGDGAMVFQFDNINLPDSTSDEPGSHGYITYRIKQQPDLLPGTTIENTAAIYFDYNAPVITNTALNTIKNPLTLSEKQTENYLMLYPVPAADLITVVTNSSEISNFQIIDLNGNIVMNGSVSNGDQISVEEISNGIYFFRMDNGTVEKLVVNK